MPDIDFLAYSYTIVVFMLKVIEFIFVPTIFFISPHTLFFKTKMKKKTIFIEKKIIKKTFNRKIEVLFEL